MLRTFTCSCRSSNKSEIPLTIYPLLLHKNANRLFVYEMKSLKSNIIHIDKQLQCNINRETFSVRYIQGTNVIPTFVFLLICVDIFVRGKQDRSILLNFFHQNFNLCGRKILFPLLLILFTSSSAILKSTSGNLRRT